MGDIKIDKGIPYTGKRGLWKRLLKKMQPGESVLLSKNDAKQFQYAAHGCGAVANLAVKTLSQEDGQVRCWVVERQE